MKTNWKGQVKTMKNMKKLIVVLLLVSGVSAHAAGADTATPVKAVWTPAQLGGDLVLWLDAQDTGTITKDGAGLVSQWEDKSGKGNHVTSSAGHEPTFVATGGVNGLQSLAFAGNANGEGKYMGKLSPTGLPTGNASYTALVVYEHDATLGGSVRADYEYLLSVGGDATGAKLATIEMKSGAGGRFVHHGRDASIDGPPPFRDGNPNFYINDYDATTFTEKLYFNGTFVDDHDWTADGGLALNPTAISLNAFSVPAWPALGSQAYIGEIVLVSGLLSDEDRQKLEGYVARKWYYAARKWYSNADPFNGETDVKLDLSARTVANAVSWDAPAGVTPDSYDVYMDTDLNAIAEATAAEPGTVYFSKGQTGTSFCPGVDLSYDQTYYWRVDATVDLGSGPEVLTGDVWSFESYMEPYTPPSSERQQAWRKTLASGDYAAIAKAYADYMIEHGRDRYGKVHSPLFVSILDRKSATVPKGAPYPHVITKPYAPGLRQDHKMRPHDRTGAGANPLQDLPLYGLLYRLTELTGKKRYAEEADKSIAWFLENAQNPATGLYAWGSHVFWNVHTEQAAGWHEYNYVWPYWDRHPEALKRFAHGLWNHQITDQRTGRFSRHADYHRHGPGGEAFDFPQCGACFMDIWAREYGRSGDATSKQALEMLLKMYRSLRHPETGAMSWCSSNARHRRENASITMNVFMATALQDAAAHVEKRDPELAEDMRTFVRFMEDEHLSNDYDELFDVAVKGILTIRKVARPDCYWPDVFSAPEGVDASVGYSLKTLDGKPAASLAYLTPWFPGRSYAEFAILLKKRLERCEEKHKATYRRILLDTADIYMTIGPEVQFAQYPDNVSDVVELLRYVYKLTDDVAYLHRADQMMRLGLRLFFDETSPLPKITNFDDWYESSLKNESSVEILRQMLELSLDLEKLPEARRAAPRVAAEARDGAWHARLDGATPDAMLQYGSEHQHGLYLSQRRGEGRRQISLSDVITRIPTVQEADELNGRMKRFTGKYSTTTQIAYGGLKDVPRNVTLTISNTGEKAVRVRVEATLHDTYHDNGQEKIEKTIPAGQQASFALAAAPRKWIRHLTVTGDIKEAPLELKGISFKMAPRNDL